MKNLGFSILECMIAIAILAFSYLIAIPNLQRFEYIYSGKTLITKLQQVLHYARSMAIAQQKNVIICPSANGYGCASNWSRGILITQGHIKQYFKLNSHLGLLSLQQSGNNNLRIEVLPSGMLYVNGRFNYKNPQVRSWSEFNLYFNKALRTYITYSNN